MANRGTIQFFGCALCPNKVFSSEKAVTLHKLKHEQENTSEKTDNQSTVTEPKLIYLESTKLFPNKRPYNENDELSNEEDSDVEPSLQVVPKSGDLSKFVRKWRCKMCINVFEESEPTLEEHLRLHLNLKKEDIMQYNPKLKMARCVPVIKHIYFCKICNSTTHGVEKAERHFLRHAPLCDTNKSEEELLNLLKSDLMTNKLYCRDCGIRYRPSRQHECKKSNQPTSSVPTHYTNVENIKEYPKTNNIVNAPYYSTTVLPLKLSVNQSDNISTPSNSQLDINVDSMFQKKLQTFLDSIKIQYPSTKKIPSTYGRTKSERKQIFQELINMSMITETFLCKLCPEIMVPSKNLVLEHVSSLHAIVKEADLISRIEKIKVVDHHMALIEKTMCKICQKTYMGEGIKEHVQAHKHLLGANRSIEHLQNSLIIPKYSCKFCGADCNLGCAQSHVFKHLNTSNKEDSGNSEVNDKQKSECIDNKDCTEEMLNNPETSITPQALENVISVSSTNINSEHEEMINLIKSQKLTAAELLEKSLIVRHWICKLCKHIRFTSQAYADEHFNTAHNPIKVEDLKVKADTQQIRNGKEIKFFCKLCRKKFFTEEDADEHYPKHTDLYYKNLPVPKKPTLIFPRYDCAFCDRVWKFKQLQGHLWEHFNQFKNGTVDKVNNPPAEVIETKPNENIVTQNAILDNRCTVPKKHKGLIIVRDLMMSVGITRESKTSGLKRLNLPQVPDKVFSCLLCPHLPMFYEVDIPDHMNRHHQLTQDFEVLLTSIPIDLVIEKNKLKNGIGAFIIGCVCQFAIFNEKALSSPALDAAYKQEISKKYYIYTDDNLDGITKLQQIYQSKFTCHSALYIKIKPSLKKKLTSGGQTIGMPSLTRDVILGYCPRRIVERKVKKTKAKLTTVTNNVNVVVIQQLMNKIGIAGNINQVEVELRRLCEIPNVLYSCFLCPHLTMFTEDDVNLHVTLKHNTPNTYPLIAKITADLLVLRRYVGSNRISIVYNCICQFSSFPKEIYSLPIIDEVYQEVLMGNKDNIANSHLNPTNAEDKLLAIYQYQFVSHYRNNCIIKPDPKTEFIDVRNYPRSNVELPSNCNIDSSSSSSDVELSDKDISAESSADENDEENMMYFDDLVVVDECTVDEDTSVTEDIKEEDAAIDEFNEVNDENVFVVKDLLKKVGITEYSRTSSVQTRILSKVPDMVYGCCLCPHLAIFSEDDVSVHMKCNHKLTDDYSIFITTVPTTQLIENSFEKFKYDSIFLTCLCKFSKFSKDVLQSPLIDSTYRKAIAYNKNHYEDEEETIDAETKLLRIYECQFTSHNRHKLLVLVTPEQKGTKRKLSPQSSSISSTEDICEAKET